MDAAKVFETCVELLKSAEALCWIAHDQLDALVQGDEHDPAVYLFGARLGGRIESTTSLVCSTKWYADSCGAELRPMEARDEAES